MVRINGEPVEPIAITRLPVEGDLTVTAELPMPVRDISLGIPARRKESVRLVATGVLAKTVVEYEDLIQALAPVAARTVAGRSRRGALPRYLLRRARGVARVCTRRGVGSAWTLSKPTSTTSIRR
ncbi:hypothetical protein F2981_32755 (plasmid) [Sinorhizobium meliloti]|nr:hypothetical protein [Sinorhizobium meliloti]